MNMLIRGRVRHLGVRARAHLICRISTTIQSARFGPVYKISFVLYIIHFFTVKCHFVLYKIPLFSIKFVFFILRMRTASSDRVPSPTGVKGLFVIHI